MALVMLAVSSQGLGVRNEEINETIGDTLSEEGRGSIRAYSFDFDDIIHGIATRDSFAAQTIINFARTSIRVS